MNRINAQQAGGFPLETDTFNFLQTSFTQLQALTALGGDNYILSGCMVVGVNVTDGWVVINNELLPFKGGGLQTKVVIRETVTDRSFENGSNKPVYYERAAQFGTGANAILFSDLVRFKTLQTFKDLPHHASSAIDSDVEDTLATSRAVKLLNDKINNILVPGMIMIWSGAVNAIPTGWALCDGINGRPDLRDKFVLGAGNSYAVGASGGAKEYTLSAANLPRHRMPIRVSQAGNSDWRTSSGSGRPITNVGNIGPGDPVQTGYTDYIGGDQSFSIMPVYFSLAYIFKLL